MPNQKYLNIVDELKCMIDKKKWEKDFAEGIQKAISLAGDDLSEANIHEGETDAETVASFLDFCDRYVKWVPTTTSRRDEALWMLYAIELGSWMDTPASAAAVETFSKNPLYTVFQYIKPKHGWTSFNQFFSRKANPIYRPIAPKNTVASPCDAKFDGYWKIQDDGNVILPNPHVNFKGIEWPIKKLLDDTELAPKFNGGTLMHSFLLPNNYHRVHAPVSGKLVDYKPIKGDVYLEVTADPDKQIIGHIPRFMQPRPGKGQYEDVEAQDTPGYQWNQVRGMWRFETHVEGKDNEDIDIGTVVLFAVGMAQISSVVTDKSPKDDDDCHEDHVKRITYPKPGDWVNKGDEIGYLKYGGSDYILLFEKGKVEFTSGTPQMGRLYLQGAALVSKT